jgi:hypothetical protein
MRGNVRSSANQCVLCEQSIARAQSLTVSTSLGHYHCTPAPLAPLRAGTSLVYNRPEDPNAFLVEELKKKQAKKVRSEFGSCQLL